MTRRALRLVEWQTRDARLPRADAAFLLASARGVIDVVPGFDRGVYRLTPRGFVGFLDGPTVRFAVRPKIPWPNLLMLLGLPPGTSGPSADPEPALLAALARELAARLAGVTRDGLVRGYREADTESAFLRGRLRTADQLRDAAARAFPDRFHVTETVFDLDTAWNRVPKAVAAALLARPDLPPDARHDLLAALLPFEGVTAGPVTDAELAAADAEPRADGYRSLLRLCRLLHDGLKAVGEARSDAGGFLLDLGQAFERYVSEGLAGVLEGRGGWAVEAQPRFELAASAGAPVVLRPDVLLRHRGRCRLALDAKWKRSAAPDPADLHQALAYAALTGADRVGLVYPGSRSGRRELVVPGGRVRVTLYRLRVVGPTDRCAAALGVLAKDCRRRA